MEITLKLEVSERLHTLAERFAALAERYLDVTWPSAEPTDASVSIGEMHVKSAEIPLESAEPAGVVNPPAEDGPEQPAEPEAAAESSAAVQESAPKRGRGRPPKKRENLAATGTIPAPTGNQAPEPEKSPQDEASCGAMADIPAPSAAVPVADPAPAEKSDDPYHGMTLMQAVSALMAEVHDTGIELADANARVRKECEARGLPYNSAACLMKELGYDATRKIALGL